MISSVNISWSKTKRNVEQIISNYIYYSLSVDNNSTSNISDNFVLEKIKEEETQYIKLDKEEIKKRLEFINYVRFCFNKLTTDERKIIFWTYLDKENNYDDRFIANNLGFSLGYYYIKKKDALIRFAYSLGVEAPDDK